MTGPFIFLDIDGVLNKHKPHANGYCGLDSGSVAVLNHILEETKAKIVISSAWRYFILRGEMNLAGFNGLLCTHGLKWGCIVDVLGPDIPDGMGSANRGAAIWNWYENRYSISHPTKYIAIDDMDLGYTSYQIRFFKTDPNVGLEGLTDSEIEFIIGVLR